MRRPTNKPTNNKRKCQHDFLASFFRHLFLAFYRLLLVCFPQFDYINFVSASVPFLCFFCWFNVLILVHLNTNEGSNYTNGHSEIIANINLSKQLCNCHRINTDINQPFDRFRYTQKTNEQQKQFAKRQWKNREHFQHIKIDLMACEIIRNINNCRQKRKNAPLNGIQCAHFSRFDSINSIWFDLSKRFVRIFLSPLFG